MFAGIKDSFMFHLLVSLQSTFTLRLMTTDFTRIGDTVVLDLNVFPQSVFRCSFILTILTIQKGAPRLNVLLDVKEMIATILYWMISKLKGISL